MPHSKKPRLLSPPGRPAQSSALRRSSRIAGWPNANINDLSEDALALIFGFFGPVDIMHFRCCKKWREAAKKTVVPMTEFKVDSVSKYHAMRAMTTVLPNLQQIALGYLGDNHKYVDGEDPDHFMEMWGEQPEDCTIHDIEPLSHFRKLCSLEIGISHEDDSQCAPLSGRYPLLLNNFPLLQKLSIGPAEKDGVLIAPCTIRWNLEVLQGMPLLRELYCNGNRHLSGNTKSLRVLKGTLEKVVITNCGVNCFLFDVPETFEGDFMELADFPFLRVMKFTSTAVTGDIRKVGGSDFPAIEEIDLPEGVRGGNGYKFQRISDVPEIMYAVYRLMKRASTTLRDTQFSKGTRYEPFRWSLSTDSPDRYRQYDAPFNVAFVRVGSRLGWSWFSGQLSCGQYQRNSCEINWLDPEPSTESSDYEVYVKELQDIQKCVGSYRGFHQPPTEEEYDLLTFGPG